MNRTAIGVANNIKPKLSQAVPVSETGFTELMWGNSGGVATISGRNPQPGTPKRAGGSN